MTTGAAIAEAKARKFGTQPTVVAVALAGAILVAGRAAAEAGVRQAMLVVIGFAAGIALYHASFGFTSAWRRMPTERRSLGIRTQFIMIGLTIVVFFPLLARGSAFGEPLVGFVNPVGLALCVGAFLFGVGAFLFGVGMQLGGGCGSGTLYTAGGGSTRMAVTLLAFIVGSLIATADPLGWRRWPSVGAYSLVEAIGAPGALAVAVAALTLAYFASVRLERARHGVAQPLPVAERGVLVRGPWPQLAGAVALAPVNIATLVIAGRPWGITSAFALSAAKGTSALGVDVSAWPYWQGDPALGASVFADVTSVMDLGLVLGALAAAGLAGRFAPQIRLPLRPFAAAIAGGLLMGIGARLATGCNIGAFFSGTASGSLHGLVWLVFAIRGNAIGVRLRPVFRLDS